MDGIGARGSSTSSGTLVALGICTTTARGTVVTAGGGSPGSVEAGCVVVVAAGVVVGPVGGSVPLTSLARHSSPGQYSRAAGRGLAGGGGQSTTGRLTCAASMKAPQMRAG
jgi:hypothetical protein